MGYHSEAPITIYIPGLSGQDSGGNVLPPTLEELTREAEEIKVEVCAQNCSQYNANTNCPGPGIRGRSGNFMAATTTSMTETDFKKLNPPCKQCFGACVLTRELQDKLSARKR